jgi:hypothetical protein
LDAHGTTIRWIGVPILVVRLSLDWSQMSTSVDGVLHRFTTILATSGLMCSSALKWGNSVLLVARIHHEAKKRKFASKLTKKEMMKTKYLQSIVVLSTLTLLFPLGALARDNKHSVDIIDAVQVGSTQLKPGNYKVEWQGTGPVVQVSFQHNGETVVTLPATLKTNDDQVTQDSIETRGSSADEKVLEEIDFGRQKEALVFDQNAGSM